MKKSYDLNGDYQPREFAFKSKKAVSEIISRYPQGGHKSAVMPLLDMAQRQNDGWIPRAAMDEIALILDMPDVNVYEVASFYSMYNMAPIGKYHVQCCGTTPCWLRGAQGVIDACRDMDAGDGMITVSEVECLGACTDAPVVQINDDYYENLTPEGVRDVISKMVGGKC